MPKVISANRLADGIVVYLGQDCEWTDRLDAARIFAEEAEAQAGLEAGQAAVRQNLILDPCAVDILAGTAELKPLRLRDAIRAKGPTIDFAPRFSVKPV